MKAYIDNNIIIDFEQNTLTKEMLLENVDSTIKMFFYSSAHLQEANEITGLDNEKTENLIKRFNSISNITDNNYLHHEIKTKKIYHLIQNPQTVYNDVTEISFAQTSMKSIVNTINEEQKQLFRDQLGINSKELNNYSAVEVVNHINSKKDLFGGMTMVELIEKAIELHPQNEDFGLHNKISGLFELLDMIGYWKDKYSPKSNYARLWDSSHTYYSSFCDYFISDDKKTRNKAKVAFYLYGINTKVISSKGLE
ncbi:hypothetical protein AM493_09585 [Flavobacterium akiainvivens]|uniref:Uncharacterized protein n=1 Tax=Flavobacterium akiainvivens TaxID=1202724 RepID=A0A0M8MAW6_9FLAO|nr:hypothetical protein [Flavobacterium akiainvivens]KOS06255.1 hypothetical protein AM493_09585 [Flavobacterium akiainvivens]SFQ17840.1 hypothetical protein SAMN05444144_101448 [Flavobacterium akiainvivens]